MNLTSKEIIKNLNERLLTQSIVVETLCDLLIESGVITYDDLENMIQENLLDARKKLKKFNSTNPTSLKIKIKSDLEDTLDEFDDELLKGLYFGPVGQA